MPAEPYILCQASLKDVQDVPWEVAVLPWGATEPHNFHLPYGTDTLQATAIAAESARKAWAAGARCIVLPTVPYGVNTQQMQTTLTINMNPSTQAIVLRDIVRSVEMHGIRRLVLVNGHGGNDFRQMIRELQAETTVFLSAVNWFAIVPTGGYFDDAGDHAGELETSVMQRIHPEFVHPLDAAGPGKANRFRVKALREGWAWAPRDWKQVTADTGVGDPARATPEKGERYVEAVTDRLASFFVELAGADPDQMYE